MINLRRRQNKVLACYFITVAFAACILFIQRWPETDTGFWELLDVLSISIWHAVVWPFYLLVKALA